MKRLTFALLLVLVLTACALATPSQRDSESFHSNATSRRCVRRLELSSSGYGQSGVTASFNDYGAAESFSDDWVDVDWVVENRTLHAHITNRTKLPIMIDGVIVNANKERVAIRPLKLGARSSQTVRLASLDEIREYTARRTPPSSGTNVQLELCMRIAQEECKYHFQLAPAPF